MKTGTAAAEKNTGRKLTIPVKTRSPIEAFQMLRQGQPIDTMAAYYDDQVGDDFWMMDKTAKLHKLAELKEREGYFRQSIIDQQAAIEKINQIAIQNAKESQQNNQTTEGNNQKFAGSVSQSRSTGERSPGNNAGEQPF